MRELTRDAGPSLLRRGAVPPDAAFYLRHAIKACRGGVAARPHRAFRAGRRRLLELFTHDGVGTMVGHRKPGKPAQSDY